MKIHDDFDLEIFLTHLTTKLYRFKKKRKEEVISVK